MNFSQKFNELALRAMLVLGLTASGAASAACDVSLVSVFANGQAVLKADCGTVSIFQITWFQNGIPIPSATLNVTPTTQDIYYTTAITTGTATFSASGNTNQIAAGKAATIISGQTTLTVAIGLVSNASGTPVGSVSSTPAGIVCPGGSCTATYSVGSAVILTATPGNATSFFGGWGGDCSGTGACVLAMTGPRSVTATFTSAPPPPPPVCSVSASPSSVSFGTATTVTLTANCPGATNYLWSGTSGAPSVSGNTSSVTVSFPSTTVVGAYSYSVTATNLGGSSTPLSTTVTVSSVPAPSCTLSASPTAVTPGASSILTASCPTATSYAWTGGTCAGTAAATCTVTPTVATTYTVAGINAGGTGAAASATVAIAAPSSLPAGCTAGPDVTWGLGLSYNTAGAPNIAMASDMAIKVPTSYFGNKTSGAYRYGNVQFYELGAAVTYSISASPCNFAVSPTAEACQGTSSAAQSADHYYVTNDSPAPPSSSYCQLPALPSGQTHYFVNLRPTGTLGTFFLLFD